MSDPAESARTFGVPQQRRFPVVWERGRGKIASGVSIVSSPDIVEWGFWIVAVGVASFCEVLGLSPPLARCGAVLTASVVPGVVVAYFVFDAVLWEVYLCFAVLMALESAALLASLAVLRSGGYRLAGRSHGGEQSRHAAS